MKNLSNYFQMTSDVNENIITIPCAPKDCNLVVVSAGKGGLIHFYVLKAKKYLRVASEMCKNFSIQCDGRILQLDFAKFSSLYYVDMKGGLVNCGHDLKNVQYFVGEQVVHIKAVQEVLVVQDVIVEDSQEALSTKQIENEEKSLFYDLASKRLVVL